MSTTTGSRTRSRTSGSQGRPRGANVELPGQNTNPTEPRPKKARRTGQQKHLLPLTATEFDPNKPLHFLRRGPHAKYMGQLFDWGQVLQLQGRSNDEKNVRFGIFAPLEDALAEGQDVDSLPSCPDCGAVFTADSYRDRHVKKRHLRMEMTEQEEEREYDRELSLADKIAPFTNVGEARPVQL